MLLDRVRPGPEDEPPRVETMTTGEGQLSIAYRTHLLTPQDLLDGAAKPGGPAPSARDEHNRPLRLVVGFVSPDRLGAHPRRHLDADLDACQRPALAAYRQFLQDETVFQVTASTPLRLSCSAAPQPGRTAGPPPAAAVAPAFPPSAPARRGAITVGVLLVAVVALLVLVFAFRASRTATPCPSTTSSSVLGSANPGSSATCPPSAVDR